MAELTNRNLIQRHVVQGEQAHLCEAQSRWIWTACRSGSVSQKAIYPTEGDLELHELETEKSAEVILVRGNELSEKAEVSQSGEGPNVL